MKEVKIESIEQLCDLLDRQLEEFAFLKETSVFSSRSSIQRKLKSYKKSKKKTEEKARLPVMLVENFNEETNRADLRMEIFLYDFSTKTLEPKTVKVEERIEIEKKE